MNNKKALILDANSLLHRTWHALPPMFSSKNEMVNAVYGFVNTLISILAKERPDVFVACWDTKAPTFRHEAMKEYKAQRERQPDEFYNQIQYAKQVVELLGGRNFAVDGYEADDLLGTLEKKKKKDHKVILLTSDRDAWQLIEENVFVLTFKKGVTETVLYDRDNLKKIFGLYPEQIIDYKVLSGDSSDNISGVRGIGDKTAKKLLNEYGDLKTVLKEAKKSDTNLKKSLAEKLIENEDLIHDTELIVKIVTNVPLKFDKLSLKRKDVVDDDLIHFFIEMGFKSLLKRLYSKKSNSQVLEESKKSDLKLISSLKDWKVFVKEVEVEKKIFIYFNINDKQTSLFDDVLNFYLASGKSLVKISSLNGFRSEFLDVMMDGDIKKISNDLKLVWHKIDSLGGVLNGLYFDLGLAGYLLEAGERNNDLNSLAMTYLKINLLKDVDYIRAIRGLFIVLEKKLKGDDLLSLLNNIEVPLVSILAKMEKVGIKINKKYFLDLSKELTLERNKLEKKMQKLAGEEFNPASTKQLARILFEVLDISTKGIKRGKTGFSTASSELDKLQGVHPIIELIERYRGLSKLLSTYVDTIPNIVDENNRIHTTFNQNITATGRLSSSDPNLQNIPVRSELGKRVRDGFIAKKGFVLLSCDYSQVELRIVAVLANDQVMLQAFKDGLDVHRSTAANIWGLKLEEVTDKQRSIAKTINFGIIFGQGPHGLAKTAEISYGEALEFIKKYFDVFAGIKTWMEKIKDDARQNGYVETMFGRRRKIDGIDSTYNQIKSLAERLAVNMPVQGTEADLIKLAMIKLNDIILQSDLEISLLLQVHDELIFEVSESKVEQVAQQIKGIMENVEDIGCPIVVDAKFGKSWGGMRKMDL